MLRDPAHDLPAVENLWMFGDVPVEIAACKIYFSAGDLIVGAYSCLSSLDRVGDAGENARRSTDAVDRA